MRLDPRLIAPLADRLEALEPLEILRAVSGALGRRAAILCSMQRAEAALCHMADRAGLALDVVFVDTGVLFRRRSRPATGSPRPTRTCMRSLEPARSFDAQTREGRLVPDQGGARALLRSAKDAPLRAIRAV
jgi:phosphoadenosine phosphosulfate reductase